MVIGEYLNVRSLSIQYWFGLRREKMRNRRAVEEAVYDLEEDETENAEDPEDQEEDDLEEPDSMGEDEGRQTENLEGESEDHNSTESFQKVSTSVKLITKTTCS
ncbi:unnamed protein product [Caenorhabditis nigoni]